MKKITQKKKDKKKLAKFTRETGYKKRELKEQRCSNCGNCCIVFNYSHMNFERGTLSKAPTCEICITCTYASDHFGLGDFNVTANDSCDNWKPQKGDTVCKF